MKTDPDSRIVSDPASPGPDDLSLLRTFLDRGDRRALGTLFARHADSAYRTALRVCRHAADAEDAVQTAFIEVLRQAAKYRGESAVKPWILGFVVNACRHKAREEGRRSARENRASQAGPGEASPSDREMQETVRSAVQGLPEPYRVPLWLHYCEGLSSGEVAQALSLSENTVRSQLARGVDQLRSSLAAQHVVVSAGLLAALLGAAAVETAPPALAATLSSLAGSALPASVPAVAKASLLAKVAAGLVTMAALASTASLVLWGGPPADPFPPELSWVEERVRDWQPQPEERRFDEIGWAPSLSQALALAKSSRRPIFVLAHVARFQNGRSDGGSMSFRAGPLSDPRVIETLNRRFVPVYTVSGNREDPELRRIYREACAKKLVVGSECLYFLDPEGQVTDSLHICGATTGDFLSRLLAHAGPDGPALVSPRPQSTPPPAPGDSLVLHVTARYLDSRGQVERTRGDYHEFPAEDWVVLSREAWSSFLPERARKGFAWAIPQEVARELLLHFYPLTGNFGSAQANAPQDCGLRATVAACRGAWCVVRIDAEVRINHSFYPQKDERRAESSAVGFAELDLEGRRIRRFEMATLKGLYGKDSFGVAVRSIEEGGR